MPPRYARSLEAASQFASLTRPDRYAAGASRSSVNLTATRQANLAAGKREVGKWKEGMGNGEWKVVIYLPR
jgi:hypothetical protein